MLSNYEFVREFNLQFFYQLREKINLSLINQNIVNKKNVFKNLIY
jgi:hypothetical protein